MSYPVISAWSAVSPFGLGRAAFASGVAAGRRTAAAVDTQRWQVPDRQACLVPGFEVREVLGKKGTRAMDRVTGLAVSTVGALLEERPAETGPSTGLVLGITCGSAQSMMDFTRSSLLGKKPYDVDPSRMANGVMNCAAGQCAIWYRLRGPNSTIATGQTAGLFALGYGLRLLASGRAETVLCGAAEEYSHARSWLEHHGHGDREPLGEGCAMLLVEPAGGSDRPPLAEVLAVESRVHTDGDLGTALAACAGSALAKAGVRAEDVWAVAPGGLPGVTGETEHAVLADLFDAPVRIPCGELLGNTGAASAAFQLAAVLSLEAGAGRVALVTSVDRDGTVACALLRLSGEPR
ncbi:beta-ketoacyl synthase N-terminal-like domain-containing protein [Amycolatopsis anabasis]|uniref:beta-ketoacyl synthase N-terminal-like domain-containing protein n=1 Tax=Amycolatopsis anabasis TaxID=1840409 RepID=UPI00131E5860|nr:beta-ketoacyl synthase N-terminal-like domain-containing protein [Amycolatopsis anabasis]